jgi:C4-dicarboxylate-specific signal transduction histidine kinase
VRDPARGTTADIAMGNDVKLRIRPTAAMVMSDATILENILRILVRNALDLPEATNGSHRQLMIR